MADSTSCSDPIIERYRRAGELMRGQYTEEVVRNACLFPVWSEDGRRFIYKRTGADGEIEFRLVDAETGATRPLFDRAALAEALTKVSGKQAPADALPVKDVVLETSGEIVFSAFDKRWRYLEADAACEEVKSPHPDHWVISPDDRRAVFARDFNLWRVDLETGDELQLTDDGEAEYCYAVCGEAWGVKMGDFNARQARWSPDGRYIFTVQRDTRQVKTLPVLHHVPGDGSMRPQVEHLKVAYPGDAHVEEYRVVMIDTEQNRSIDICYGPIPTIRNCQGFFDANLGWWSTDSRFAYFVHVDRYYKSAKVVEVEAGSGKTRVLFEETSDTQINLSLNADMAPVLKPLPQTNELLWCSERTGWAHLYLYDLNTGALKSTVTSGDWLVREIVAIDENKRELVIQTAGRHARRDPYYRDLARVRLDTGDLETIIESDHDYFVSAPNDMQLFLAAAFGEPLAGKASGVSPDAAFAVVTQSRADEPSRSFVVDRQGDRIMELDEADISRLPDGWMWPELVELKAEDGKTDLYGLIYRPSNFSPEKAYPVVSHVFNTVELPWVPKGAFSCDGKYGLAFWDAAALAELGFIVVQIDARGTPLRHKAFLDHSYGWLESAGELADHVAGIKQLAERYPYIDLDRVGITAHASGGPAALLGLIEYPDFYKVGVQGTLHDARVTGATMWADKYEGPQGSRLDRQHLEARVDRLQGKLQMQHGLLDAVCPPLATLRVVEALEEANKDFELLLSPKVGHGNKTYSIRRAWDFLVRHLQGVEPPKEFKLIRGMDILLEAHEAR